MLIISPLEFNQYINNYDADSNKEIYCSTAQTIVEDYLGYPLVADDYSETIRGALIELLAMPVNEIYSLKVDGIDIDLELVEVVSNIVTIDPEIRLTRHSKTEISYNAGFPIVTIDEVEQVAIPSKFKMAVLKIASLLFLEQGGNIGVTGLSADNGMNRTFINYSNYNKHLQILSRDRIIRL